jgi:hypothetical protein
MHSIKEFQIALRFVSSKLTLQVSHPWDPDSLYYFLESDEDAEAIA